VLLVAFRVVAAMNDMVLAAPDSSAYPAGPQTDRQQLTTRHHSVLTLGEVGDLPVPRRPRRRLCSYATAK
jgi:hypothetical protein